MAPTKVLVNDPCPAGLPEILMWLASTACGSMADHCQPFVLQKVPEASYTGTESSCISCCARPEVFFFSERFQQVLRARKNQLQDIVACINSSATSPLHAICPHRVP